MEQDRRNWVRWIRVLTDPAAVPRGFSLEGLEFPAKHADPVEDTMYGTLAGDTGVQDGKFWVVSEKDFMRICPQMEKFAKGEDWFFPVEFCDSLVRPSGVEPAQTREATAVERTEGLKTFQGIQQQLASKVNN